MRRFSNLKSYELTEVQNIIQDIYHLKRNDHISDLNEGELEEIRYYKNCLKILIKIFKT